MYFMISGDLQLIKTLCPTSVETSSVPMLPVC